MATNHQPPSTAAPARPRPVSRTNPATDPPITARDVNQLMLDLVHRTEYLDPADLQLLARFLETLYKVADPARVVDQVATGN